MPGGPPAGGSGRAGGWPGDMPGRGPGGWAGEPAGRTPAGVAEPVGRPGAPAAPVEEPAARNPGARATAPAHAGMYPPMVGAGAGDVDREHRRPDYLLDDGDAFADDRWFPPPVLGAGDPLPRPRRWLVDPGSA